MNIRDDLSRGFRIFFEKYDLSSKDLRNCQKVCRLFNAYIEEFETFWKGVAQVFDPENKWEPIKNGYDLTWKRLVINFTHAERKTLDLLALQEKDPDFKKTLEKTQYYYLIHFQHSDNPKILRLLSDSYLHGKGCPKDEQKAAEYADKATKNKNFPVQGAHDLQDVERQTLELLALQDQDPVFRQTLKRENQYKYLTHFVETENPEMLYFFGDCYLSPLDKFSPKWSMVEDSIAKAKWCFETAALKGHVKALHTLAVCYAAGFEYQKNLGISFLFFKQAIKQENGVVIQTPFENRAFNYYQEDAKRGVVLAQYILGMCYENGIGCRQDPATAFDYYKLAAKRWLTLVKKNIHYCHFHGKDCQPSHLKRFHYFKWTEQLFDHAQHSLGVCYQGSASSVVNENEETEKELFAEAQYNLGYRYFEGKGCPQDLDKAFHHVEFAAKLGHAEALCTLGVGYFKGIGYKEDPAQAFHYFNLAAEQRSARAQFHLGNCYEKAIGCTQDLDNAFEYYQLAADQGHVDAQFDLARCYFEGKGCPQNEDKAFDYLKLAANQGDVRAQYNVGLYYLEGRRGQQDPDKAFHYLKLAADQGYVPAQCNLGICYLNGIGCKQDQVKAVHCFERVAAQGDAEAQYNAGICYENGTGCTKDLDKAFAYYQLAAKQGFAQAQVNLGMCYLNGIGCTQDPAQAVYYFKLAADQGQAEALYNLGFCYKNGKGCTQDLAQAIHYFELAAEQGDADAQYKLGLCYEKGIGCQQDLATAFHYYEKAAKQGHAVKDILARVLYNSL